MTKSLSDKFPNEFPVNQEGLKALETKFERLSGDIKIGAYVLEAEEEASQSMDTLHVTIKPSEKNSTSSIESMRFDFQERSNDEYSSPSTVRFKIRTKEGKTLVGSHDVQASAFLGKVLKIGRETVEAATPERAAIDVIKNLKL
jgi:hypothetical protein